MSIASQITTMQEHIEDIYDTFAVAGVDTSAAAKNIVNINANLKERLEYYLANGLDVVWDNWSKVSGSGTTLSLNNTIQAKMDFVYKGNTSQESTTGKNLLGLPDGTYSDNGITAVISNGKITLNGTATATSFIILTLLKNIVLTNQTVTISTNNSIAGGDNLTEIRVYTSSSSYMPCQFNTINNSVTYTNKTDTYSRFQIRTSSGVTYNNFVLYPQLEVGSSDTSYEPYTNGPAPNPDYPMPVNVVTGDNEVKIEGKNLVDTSKSTPNKSIFASGIILNSPNINTTDYIYVGDKSSIAISFTSDLSATWNTCYFDENKNVVAGGSNGLSITAGKNGHIHTLSANQKYIRFCYPSDSQDVMLESGSSKTTFEPYKSQTYSINLGSMELCKIGDYQDYIAKSTGKNLFDGTGWRLVSSGNGFPQPSAGATIISSDKNNISFTSTQQTYAGVESGFIKVKANETYTLSANFKTPTNRFFVTQYDENKVRVGTLNTVINPPQNTTFTTTNNGYIAISFTNTTTSSTTYVINNIQIEKSSTVSSYEPYGKVWYKYGAIGKVVLDGSESGWANMYTNTQGLGTITVDLDNLVYQSNKSGLCNYFIYKWVYNNPTPCFYVYNNNNIGRIMFITNFQTKTEFMTWLSTHNTTVYYVLNTPTITPITDTTLINQLETIKLSYNEQTNISQTNTDKPFILDVTALKDLDAEDTTPTLATNRGLLFTQPPVSENFINDEDDNSVLEETINEEEPNIEDDNREEEEPVGFFEKEIINNDEEQEEIPTEPIEIDNGQR